VLENTMRLLHPFVPFVTETVTQQLYGGDHMIMTAAYPEADGMIIYDKDAMQADFLIGFIKAVRNLKAVFHLPPTEKQSVVAVGADSDITAITANAEAVKFVGRFADISTQLDPAQRYIKGAYGTMQVMILAKSDFDYEGELKVLDAKLALLRADIAKIEARLGNQDFLARAPAEVVDKDTQKLEDLRAEEQLIGTFLRGQG
ncbi:MAG TPA: class I tRNA ligase family protein, partial [Clostridia bacterium]|nr:class I tRNA ligase family protein [Clostridia bacterium]